MARQDVAGHTERKGARRTPKFRRRAEARPDEVLDAALELFMEKGFEATRVEDIAKRAGLSKGSVYLYFSSKEALLEGLIRRAVVPITEDAMMSAQAEPANPREAVTRIMRTIATRFNDPRLLAIPKIVVREATVVPSIAEMYRKAVLDRAIPVMTGILKKGIAEGHFRPVDPELTIRSLIGPVLVHVLLAEIFGVMPEGGLQPEKLIENHLSILFDGLSVKEVPDG